MHVYLCIYIYIYVTLFGNVLWPTAALGISVGMDPSFFSWRQSICITVEADEGWRWKSYETFGEGFLWFWGGRARDLEVKFESDDFPVVHFSSLSPKYGPKHFQDVPLEQDLIKSTSFHPLSLHTFEKVVMLKRVRQRMPTHCAFVFLCCLSYLLAGTMIKDIQQTNMTQECNMRQVA